MIEFSRHAFPGYDQSAQLLLHELSTMAEGVESLIGMLAAAVHGTEAESAKAKILDKEINQLEYDIIGNLHTLLSKYSPSLEELRLLISTVRIAAALERIGDIAKVNVKRLAHHTQDQGAIPEPYRSQILDMLDMTQGMLRAALHNLIAFDTDNLARILEQDSKVDEIYIALMKALQADAVPANAPLTQLLSILVKDIERAADHTFEMARIAYFAHTGEKPRKKQLRKV